MGDEDVTFAAEAGKIFEEVDVDGKFTLLLYLYSYFLF